MEKNEITPRLIVKPPIINAVFLSKIILLIPAKRQNGNAIRNA